MRIPSSRTSALWVLVALMLMSIGSTSAKPTAKFDQHLADAQRFYSAKQYDESIAELHAAYEIDPRPSILINIGRCHYLADRPKQALDYYNRALSGELTRTQREEVTASVAKATIKLQEQERKAAEEQRAADRARLAALTASAPAPKPPEKPLYKKAWFWGIIGAVAAAGLAVGLGVGLRPMEPPAGPPDVIR